MIEVYNQKIEFKGKLVEFDKLPLELKEILLTLWKVKDKNKYLKTEKDEPKRNKERTKKETS